VPQFLKSELVIVIALIQGGVLLAILLVINAFLALRGSASLDLLRFTLFVLLALLGVAALFGLVVTRNRRHERRRHNAIAAWADSKGWTLRTGSDVPPVGWARRLKDISNRQRSGQVSMLLTGTHANRRFSVADYVYEVKPDQAYIDGVGPTHPVPVVVTVVVIHMEAAYPEVRIVRLGAGSHLWRAVRGRTSEELGYPAALAARFRVSAPDPAGARELISAELTAHLSARDVRWLDLQGQELITTWTGRLDLARIGTALDTTCRIAEVIEYGVSSRSDRML